MAPAKRAQTYRQRDDLGGLLGQGRRTMWSAASRRLETNGESMLAWHLIRTLMRVGSSTQCELAHAMTQHPAGVSRLLKDLEARRLVRRRRDTADRRRVRVEVTAQGQRWFAQTDTLVGEAVEETLVGLTRAERVTLRALLEKLAAAERGAKGGRR